eukprot:3273044-Prymnesium_polylepis.1
MFMLRALGQNPTKEMVQKLIAEFDSVDKDGKIQLREFLEMYAAGFDSQNSHSTEDVQDSFRALDVDPFDEKVPPAPPRPSPRALWPQHRPQPCGPCTGPSPGPSTALAPARPL